ncbi:hypothetical protein HP499_19730 [Paenarthrobacter sp. CM16]|uniref:hypothetical protein n=1 Tax=Paenarthrobacter sp. CM16 TaxID=2738447 RepID=UPI0015572403|nr:hypothetical protein [Paenarthrobacter sp. CM16]NQD90022.1 hypothetical protein [Paenarthrobacter sp. CM16]
MRISRTAGLSVVAATLAGLLSGCTIETTPPAATSPTATRAARPMAAAQAAVAQVPGAELEAARAWDGTTAYVLATLSATEAFSGDPATLIDYSLAQLASQDEVDRGRLVRFSFEAPGQTVETTKALLASLGIDSEQYAGGSSLELANQDLDDRYGTWPAAVPNLPPSFINNS